MKIKKVSEEEDRPRTLKEKLWLKYEFSESELSDISKQLALKTQSIAEAEEQKKAVVAQFAERITNAKAAASEAARKINNGYEMRNVACTILLDCPSVGTARILRDDTSEIVRERAMTADELQLNLSFDEATNP